MPGGSNRSHTQVCMNMIYIYIYIYRERDAGGSNRSHTQECMNMIYIYIYIERERDAWRLESFSYTSVQPLFLHWVPDDIYLFIEREREREREREMPGGWNRSHTQECSRCFCTVCRMRRS
jgi:hypothetical protein